MYIHVYITLFCLICW